MTSREVVLDGGSPWGFRIHGGADVQQPLRISRVNPGSKAALRGIREGDIITSINNEGTRELTNADAHNLLKNSGDTLKLGLNEDLKGSPKRRLYKTVEQQKTHSESIEQSSSSKTTFTSSTTLTIKRSRPEADENDNNSKANKENEPQERVISQRSTLSSSCSSSPSGASGAEPGGTGARHEERAVIRKPVPSDNDKYVITDIAGMGGGSRSQRRRANRKKAKQNTVASGGTMVEEPPCGENAKNGVISGPIAQQAKATEKAQQTTKRASNVPDGSNSNKRRKRITIESETKSAETIFNRLAQSSDEQTTETFSKPSNDKLSRLETECLTNDVSDTKYLESVSENTDKPLQQTATLKLIPATNRESSAPTEDEAVEKLILQKTQIENVSKTVSESAESTNESFTETIRVPEKSGLLEQETELSEQSLSTVSTQIKHGEHPSQESTPPTEKEHVDEVTNHSAASSAEQNTEPSTGTTSTVTEKTTEKKPFERIANYEVESPELTTRGKTTEENQPPPGPGKKSFERITNHGAKSPESTTTGKTTKENKPPPGPGKKPFERITNYRVESPETVEKRRKKPKTNGMVKSRSLDDDDVNITELSETSEGEECNAVIQEAESAESDVEREKEEGLKEGPNVTLISPEDEHNLRTFLQGLKLITAPEDASLATKREESYKERKARKRAAIAEHFMPVLYFPRYLDVIREETSDNSDVSTSSSGDKFHRFIKSPREKDLVVVGSTVLPADNIEGTWITSKLEASSDTELVYIDDSSGSRTPSDSSDVEEQPAKLNSSETADTPSSSAVFFTNDVKVPASQLTPPPTPDLSTPQSETINLEQLFNNHDQLSCQEPYKHTNALSPSRCSSVSSESSKTNSQSTARYNPMGSSVGDVEDLLKEEEGLHCKSPETLKELCLKELMSLPFGVDILEELAEVSQSIEELTGSLQAKISPSLQRLRRQFPLKREVKQDGTRWIGLPTQQDPRLLLCLSPTQKAHLESTKKIPNEAEKLLELHEKFINRRGYHEEIKTLTTTSRNDERVKLQDVSVEIQKKASPRIATELDAFEEPGSTLPEKDEGKEAPSSRSFKPGEYTNRLLAIIRETSDANSRLSSRGFLESAEVNNFTMTDNGLNRQKSTSAPYLQTTQFPNVVRRLSSGAQCNPARRLSLPSEAHHRQMEYIREKERNLQEEIEKLEEEKRNILKEMAYNRQFELENYHISKKGDYAVFNDEKVAPTEIFRQKMYNEYMQKVADREERKMHKVIKITSSKVVQENSTSDVVTHVAGIEDEFMDKVKERMHKFGLKKDDSEERPQISEEQNVIVMDGGSLTTPQGLPKHLREFVNLTLANAEEGVWSPGQKPPEVRPIESSGHREQPKDEQIPSVWTPRSAGSSPSLDRKEFRTVNFDSPVLERKNKPKQEPLTPESPPQPRPWKAPEGGSKTATAPSSTSEKRLPTSRSAPLSGFTELSTPRLPRAQNPTITLLQKAREGQLPRGASYLQTDSVYSTRNHDDRPPVVGPGCPLKHEYTSDSDSERPRRMVDLGRRKLDNGVGPITQDGMPLVLRSEVKDQSKWYKKMYDTIHKQKPDRDYVTIRYKQRRARYPYTSGYFSEPEHNAFSADYYDSDGTFSDSKYATLDRRRPPPTVQIKRNASENQYMSSTLPKGCTSYDSEVVRYVPETHKPQPPPGRIENYIPGKSSISEKEAKEWWDEVMDIFDGHFEQHQKPPQPRGYMSQALKESGYESDSTLIFRKREEAIQQLSPSEHREAYKHIQKGGDVPLQGLRKPAPERPRESPRKYVENEVTIHYKTPVRQEVKESLSEEELARRQAEHMKKVYEEERRRKYLQELQDMNSRRHTDNFIPSQKSPIPLNRYDDFPMEVPKPKPKSWSPDLRLIARALYNFVGQSSRELTFRKGDIIYVRRQVDKNWYEGEHNAMIGLFPANYVEIVPYDGVKSTTRKPYEGQARAKFNFLAQTHLELSLAKGELVAITRKVDDNWFEGRIGGRKGIFPISYVDVLIDPSTPPPFSSTPAKPVASPAAHSMLVNGSAGGKESMGSHSYVPSIPLQQQFTTSYRAKPIHINSAGSYGSLKSSGGKNPINEMLHIDTHSEPIPYRALYKYKPQNDDELELLEGDVVYVLEKCDDGWYVGSSQRTGAFGTFPGNYVERI